jgi:hypothetical protein
MRFDSYLVELIEEIHEAVCLLWPLHEEDLDRKKRIKDYNPDYIHIATEGPLGLYTKKYCKKNKLKYTTALHTKFDDYLHTYYKLPKFITQKYMKFFHNGAHKTLIPTPILDIYLAFYLRFKLNI